MAQISELYGWKHHLACLMLVWLELSRELLDRGVLLRHVFMDLADGCNHICIEDLILIASLSATHSAHTAHTS